MSANQSPECGQDLYRESQEPSSLGANHKSPLLCYTKHKEVQTACSNTIISPGKNRNFNLTHAPKKKKGLRSSGTNSFVGWLVVFRAATDFKPFDIKAIRRGGEGRYLHTALPPSGAVFSLLYFVTLGSSWGREDVAVTREWEFNTDPNTSQCEEERTLQMLCCTTLAMS